MACPRCIFPRTQQELQMVYLLNPLAPTSLQYAAAAGKKRCVRHLLAAGADVNENEGLPLIHAVENDQELCAKLLVRAGADVNVKNFDYSPMLLVSAYKEMHQLVKELIKAGADVNCQNCFTALHAVAELGHASTMEALIQAGADMNAAIVDTGQIDEQYDRGGDLGLTPLHISAEAGSSKRVQLLLKSGALVNQRCEWGYNALQHCSPSPDEIDERKKDVILLLFAAGEYPLDYPVPDILKFEDIKLKLKHMCRMVIREHLLKLDPHQHLFGRIPRLQLPGVITKYLLFNMSLDEQYGDDEDEDDDNDNGNDDDDDDDDDEDDDHDHDKRLMVMNKLLATTAMQTRQPPIGIIPDHLRQYQLQLPMSIPHGHGAPPGTPDSQTMGHPIPYPQAMPHLAPYPLSGGPPSTLDLNPAIKNDDDDDDDDDDDSVTIMTLCI